MKTSSPGLETPRNPRIPRRSRCHEISHRPVVDGTARCNSGARAGAGAFLGVRHVGSGSYVYNYKCIYIYTLYIYIYINIYHVCYLVYHRFAVTVCTRRAPSEMHEVPFFSFSKETVNVHNESNEIFWRNCGFCTCNIM